MKSIIREKVNQFAGILCKIGYSSFNIETDRKNIDSIIIFDLEALGHDSSAGCYYFEYPKNPADDFLFLRVFKTMVKHDSKSFSLGKTMEMIQPVELEKLMRTAYDLLLAEKIDDFLTETFYTDLEDADE